MHDEELINSGFNPGTRAMILVTVILALAMALSPGIRTTQQVETKSWKGTCSRHVGFSRLKSKLSSGVISHSSPQVQKIGVSVLRTPLEAMSPLLYIFRSRSFALEDSCQSTVQIQITQKNEEFTLASF